MSAKEHRYQLEVRISITKEEKYRTDPDDGFWRPTQERLSVEETANLGAQDFLGVTRILGQLHDAVDAMKTHHQAPPAATP